jgi:hypothetical protein
MIPGKGSRKMEKAAFCQNNNLFGGWITRLAKIAPAHRSTFDIVHLSS